MNNSKYNLILILIIILSGTVVYSFNLDNQLFWDDDDWIINNVFVHDITWHNIKFWLTNNTLAGVGLPSNYYRPFLFFTFAFNWVISGAEPFIWHLTSNIIHIANAVLVFLLLKKALTKSITEGRPRLAEDPPREPSILEAKPQGPLRFSLNTLTAFLTALIFVIHPLNTEAVTYIAGRGDSLVMFFMLLALVFFVKSKDNPDRSLIYKSASLISMIVGILSRETGIIFPFLLMIFYISFISRDRFWISIKKAFKETWLYFGVVVVYGILRLTVLNFQNTLNFYTAPNPYSENILYRMLTFMHAFVDYIRLLFVPTGLHMERSMTVHTSLFQWPVWLGALIVVGILAMVYRLYKKGNPDFKVWFFGWGWFFVGLGPVSGITPINAVIYEHWPYLPMIGFWFIGAFYLVKIIDFLKSRKLTNYYLLLTSFLMAYAIFFGYQAIQRNILWGKPIEFFEDILKYEPQSARSNNNLGNLYFNQGNVEKAEKYYRLATETNDILPQPHFNIGSILQTRGDLFGAIKEYEKAIALDPGFHYSYQNLLSIYASQGELIKATEYGELLKQLRPDDPRVYYNLALIYMARNDRDATLENLNQGLKVVGRDSEAEQLIRDLLGRIK
ncbi:MAG: tetratricopeptide repeat protein [bacterium]|nr:tetratricopeptide repeat protein [bacterium]